MPAAIDILTDDNSNDLIFQNGDLVFGLSDAQHIDDLVLANKLWWKEFPAVGADAGDYLGSSGKVQQLAREAKIQLTNDGYTRNDVLPYPLIAVTIDSNGQVNIIPNAFRI